VRPLPIPHRHDWRKTEACLIIFNTGKADEGYLKFYNILKNGLVGDILIATNKTGDNS
jgi:hypothetical protein